MRQSKGKENEAPSTDTMPRAVGRHVETIADLERQALAGRQLGEHLGDALMERIGSMPVLLFHVVWFVLWVAINVGAFPFVPAFDPYPFGLLTTVVSLEAIFLSLFVLISQNRLTRQADKRTHLDLQVNLLIEAEVTKTLSLVQKVCEKVGVDLSDDPELEELVTRTDVRGLARTVEGMIPDAKGASAETAAKEATPPETENPAKPGTTGNR